MPENIQLKPGITLRTSRLTLPKRDGTRDTEHLHVPSPLVVVGANGSGKSRLAQSIEYLNQQHRNVTRIVAQRIVQPIGRYSAQSEDEILRSLQLQRANTTASAYDALVDQVLTVLFVRDGAASSKYRREAVSAGTWQKPPTTEIDQLVEIWNKLMPHRRLTHDYFTLSVETVPSSKKYEVREMSDGERVILYLIAACLVPPPDSLIIIDEPEIHIHPSLRDRFWDEIESRRSDCFFVYLTHDLAFAASRLRASKIWLKGFSVSSEHTMPDDLGSYLFTWQEAPTVDNFPEELVLEILGSRRPVLFVEGDKSSLDLGIYEAVYPDHYVIPRGSCEQVIRSVKALRATPAFHHLDPRGLIDRDRRVEQEVVSLRAEGIEVLDVAEVENLFLLPEVVRTAAKYLGHNPSEILAKVKQHVFTSISKEIDVQTALLASARIKYHLATFQEKKDETSLKVEFDRVTSKVDVDAIIREAKALLDKAINTDDYISLLGLYNRKGLVSQVNNIFGLGRDGLTSYVLRMLKSDQKGSFIDAFKKYLPQLDTGASTVSQSLAAVAVED